MKVQCVMKNVKKANIESKLLKNVSLVTNHVRIVQDLLLKNVPSVVKENI